MNDQANMLSSGRVNSNVRANTYMVKQGDTLYTIALAQLGDGMRYDEIYQMNRAAIDALNKGREVIKYTVYPGLILKLPS